MNKLLSAAIRELDKRKTNPGTTGVYDSFEDGFTAGYKHAIDVIKFMQKNDFNAASYYVTILEQELKDIDE